MEKKTGDKKTKQSRATLDDTIKHQERLLELVDQHIANNTCISNAETRKEYFRLFGRATFGVGTEPVDLYFNNNHRVIVIPNLEQFIGVLFYHESNKITNDFWFELLGTPINYDIDIKDAWKQIRIQLLSVFPIAKANAIRMSKELVDMKKRIKMVNTVGKNG